MRASIAGCVTIPIIAPALSFPFFAFIAFVQLIICPLGLYYPCTAESIPVVRPSIAAPPAIPPATAPAGPPAKKPAIPPIPTPVVLDAAFIASSPPFLSPKA